MPKLPIYLSLITSTEANQIYFWLPKVYLSLPQFTSVYLSLPQFTSVYLSLPKFTYVYLRFPRFS
jgi:hypothetical protein